MHLFGLTGLPILWNTSIFRCKNTDTSKHMEHCIVIHVSSYPQLPNTNYELIEIVVDFIWVDSVIFPFDLEFYDRSLWYRLDQCTHFLYRLFDDEIAAYSTSNIIRCRIQCIFVIKQPVQQMSALIELISKWSTVELEIDWTKWLWIDPMWISTYCCRWKILQTLAFNRVLNTVLQMQYKIYMKHLDLVFFWAFFQEFIYLHSTLTQQLYFFRC